MIVNIDYFVTCLLRQVLQNNAATDYTANRTMITPAHRNTKDPK